MAGIGLMHGVIDNLLRAVNKLKSRQHSMLSWVWCYKAEVEKLNETITTIKERLISVDGNELVLSYSELAYMEVVKAALYDADDKFDELVALIEWKQQQQHMELDGCLGRRNLLMTFIIVRGVRKTTKKLNGFLSDGVKFEKLKVDTPNNRRSRMETSSYLYEPSIIGRKDDVKAVIHMLLSGSSKDASFVYIVGMGGMGKTSVAQLVYNHPDIQKAFPLKIWVSVSDAEQMIDAEAIYEKILRACNDDSRNDFLKREKFLLVLDDVWNETPEFWVELKQRLLVRGVGSRILVTTRNQHIAWLTKATACVHMLCGLSEENSWNVFNKIAFVSSPDPNSELVLLGKEIIRCCGGVPLALKVVGSLLHGKDSYEWRMIQQRGSATVSHFPDVLKLSYDNLEPSMKSCFSICALFPKGFEFQKSVLISLWMAEGYIGEDQNDSSYETAEKHFSNLSRRCFFDDVKRDEYGQVVSCRLHDLMHDLAQQVGGHEMAVLKSLTDIWKESRHLFHDGNEGTKAIIPKMNIRTYLQSGSCGKLPVDALLKNCKGLRILDLHNLNISSLPSAIGKLIHLRYLDLSRNKNLQILPGSLTKLGYLETLDLRSCSMLKELPRDLSKLVKLKRLDTLGCKKLSHMPLGMDRLTCLYELSLFVLGKKESSSKLEDLKALNNLKGCMKILIRQDYTYKENIIPGYLRDMCGLKAVHIHFQGSDGDANNHSVLLKKLQPHDDLKGLKLEGYQSAEIQWSAWASKLVRLELISCKDLQEFPSISNLENLKSLVLRDLNNVEYMDTSYASRSSIFFPSLETLEISGLQKLTVWWKRSKERQGQPLFEEGQWQPPFEEGQWQPPFENLSEMRIQNCPALESFPPCLNLVKLSLREVENLSTLNLCSSGVGKLEVNCSKLRELEIDDVGCLGSLPKDHLETIHIMCVEKQTSIWEIVKQFRNCSSLRSLRIDGRLSQEPRTSSSESSLHKRSGDAEELNDDKPGEFLCHNLNSLELQGLEGMSYLPEGMQYLTSLRNLHIIDCTNLKVIPEWISCLSSLKFLSIINCSNLKSLPKAVRKLTSLQHLDIKGHSYLRERCRYPDGEDWSNIQHIPTITISQSLD